LDVLIVDVIKRSWTRRRFTVIKSAGGRLIRELLIVGAHLVKQVDYLLQQGDRLVHDLFLLIEYILKQGNDDIFDLEDVVC